MINEKETYNFSLKEAKRLPIPTYWLDERIITINCNDACLDAYRLSEATFAGQTLPEFFTDPNHGSLVEKRCQGILGSKKPCSEIESFLLDNRPYCILDCQFPLLNQDNESVGVYGFAIPLMGHDPSVYLGGDFGAQIGQSHRLLQVLQERQQNVIYHHPSLTELTTREKECLIHTLKGHSAKVIGKYLNVSFRTVETHLEHIKKKLGVQNKQALLELCHYYGLKGPNKK